MGIKKTAGKWRLLRKVEDPDGINQFQEGGLTGVGKTHECG